ncbi:MAG: cyclohexanecarboxylate-CoA ligase [Ferrovibrio sp.]|uniref:cyclohexanecarboxylate-CoA ligase n=1 Tax=Ferrovibrio sp. TaxID=1917215 RepID=UPI002639048A|nr:cyclohexanecarboxylate-CoA ligase [Ferrovibrio sp.]MCW0235010.1 cyclohexanecarboxylate-CoA ligase [Ferrovibrio sp.]
MQFDPILPADRVRAMTEAGHWPGRIITDYLDRCIAEDPDRTAIVDSNSMAGQSTRLTYRELGRLVDRIALGLVELGVGKNDVVSYQLPNWWQFTALHLACVRIGAVTNPMMPIFRERELTFMLGLAESKVMVVPREFRGFDYPAMLAGIREKLPNLKYVLVIGGGGANSFEDALLGTAREDSGEKAKLFAARRPTPNDVTQLLYTSGTTGEPKGVMHTANTMMSNILPYARRLGLNRSDVVLMASPMAHQTGFMYGLMMPIMLQTTAVLQDIWEPKRAVQGIADEGVTFTMASTPFLSDLTDTVASGAGNVASLRIFLAAGAPIPRALVERAGKTLGANIISAWGMTENGAVTMTRMDDPEVKTIGTDGCPLEGVEIRVVDAANKPLPAGEEGMLKVRCCSNFVGYLKRPEWFNHDAEGWFDTGDLARIDAEGYVRITGRSKDIIIRGGENVPVVEIEGLLFRHPAIQAVAIVGVPDRRLGERACAFVVPKPGQSLTLQDIVAFLEEQKVAKQYLPERLEVVEELPRTPSGKIQKFKLREVAKTFAA